MNKNTLLQLLRDATNRGVKLTLLVDNSEIERIERELIYLKK